MRIALAQIDVTVGDLDGNLARIRKALAEAEAFAPDLIAFPELAITGYPPEDLILKPSFVADAREALDELAAEVGDAVVVVGFPEGMEAGGVHNAAAICRAGAVRHVYRKQLLPNYGVFDEDRYFEPGASIPIYRLGGDWFGVSICEDIWFPGGPLRLQAEAGARLGLNISASPFHTGKGRDREQMISTRARENGIPVAYCNLIGGQDELVFDGHSLIHDAAGELLARGAAFAEDLIVVDLDLGTRASPAPVDGTGIERVDLGPERKAPDRSPVEPVVAPVPGSRSAEVLQALTLGLADYFRKNGFHDACLGVSGGIDSAVTVAIAARALGPARVHGFYLPSPFSTDVSRAGARGVCQNLGVSLDEISIRGALRAMREALEPAFQDARPDQTEENLQARIRGTLLMALSNKFGWLVLAPGNKSELSVGYCTLYGDMVGGFAVIKDLLKTEVYAVAREINRQAGREVIPEETIDREPTAELRYGQRDTDTLPPYEVLDPILTAYIERDLGRDEIVALGFDESTVRWAIEAVDGSEYKRRQAPPGIKITTRAFGKDRRMPITNHYRE